MIEHIVPHLSYYVGGKTVYIQSNLFFSDYEIDCINQISSSKSLYRILLYELIDTSLLLIHGDYKRYIESLSYKIPFNTDCVAIANSAPNGLDIVTDIAISISYRIRQHLLSRGILGKYDGVFLHEYNNNYIVVIVCEDRL